MRELKPKYAPIFISCIEEKFFKTEAIWEFHSLMRVISGEMKIVLAENTHTFNAGDTFLVPRNQLSSVIKYPKDGLRFSSILLTFRPEQLRVYYNKQKGNPKPTFSQKIIAFDGHPLLDSFMGSLVPYLDLKRNLPEELVKIKLEEGLTILRSIDPKVDGLFSDFSEPGKIDLADFMEKNFRFNLPLINFALLTGRSISTFNRDFRKTFNAPPQKWLVQKRLELARYLISERKKKPVDIYLEIGFEDFSHFSYSFKKRFGYSPAKFASNRMSLKRHEVS